MMRRFVLSLLLTAAFAAPAAAADLTREQVEGIVHDYIMAHPQVLIDSVNAYGQAQQAADEKRASDAVLEHIDWLTKNKNHAEAGNPKGDITIVEFFDYNCGYCKKSFPELMTLLDEDKGVRLVFVEIPILGDGSVEAARWALAANKQKHYLEFHSALMRHHGPIDETVLTDYAKKAGLDLARLKKDKADAAIDATLQDNTNMAGQLGISGTPAFVVGTGLIRGYVDLAGMRQAITQARAAAKK